MDKHQIDLYNQALKDYEEAIIKIETLEKKLEESVTREARLRSDNYDLHKDLFLTKQKLERIKDLIGSNNVYLEDDCGINNITRKLLQITDEVEQ